MSPVVFLFWTAAALLGYTYVGYPALLWLWATFRTRASRARPYEPEVSVLVVAYNEAERIGARIENLLALDYPRARMEIVVASDGSTDATVERARRYRAAGVGMRAFSARRGKSAVLNQLVPHARGEIVVLADARQRFEPQALRRLLAHFADPQVGVVSGELVLENGAHGPAAGEGIGFYWTYEKFIRRRESRIDSTIGATGAIYAIRRDLYEPIPEDTLVEDVLIPLRIARCGYRVLFEPGARAYDRAATAEREFARKVRTLAGNFQLFERERWLLNPFANRLWLQTISHKGARLLSPLGLGVLFGANVFLATQPLYRWTLGLQLAFYVAAVGGHLLRNTAVKIFPLSVPYAFCLMNWATVIGFFRFASGRQRVTWETRGSATTSRAAPRLRER
ncbi:MAG: glycosyltransferase family 2 protein [Sulfurifustaceae bacterium]